MKVSPSDSGTNEKKMRKRNDFCIFFSVTSNSAHFDQVCTYLCCWSHAQWALRAASNAKFVSLSQYSVVLLPLKTFSPCSPPSADLDLSLRIYFRRHYSKRAHKLHSRSTGVKCGKYKRLAQNLIVCSTEYFHSRVDWFEFRSFSFSL